MSPFQWSLANAQRRRVLSNPCKDLENDEGDDEGWISGRSMHLPTIDWSSSEIDCWLLWKQRPISRVRNVRRFGVGGQVGR